MLLRMRRRGFKVILGWILLLVIVPRLMATSEPGRGQEKAVDEIQEQLDIVYAQLNMALVEILKSKRMEGAKRDVEGGSVSEQEVVQTETWILAFLNVMLVVTLPVLLL